MSRIALSLRFVLSMIPTLVLMVLSAALWFVPMVGARSKGVLETAHANVCAANWEVHDWITKG